MTQKDSAILVHLKSVRGQFNLWKSTRQVQSYLQGNIRMAASVLLVSNTFEKNEEVL